MEFAVSTLSPLLRFLLLANVPIFHARLRLLPVSVCIVLIHLWFALKQYVINYTYLGGYLHWNDRTQTIVDSGLIFQLISEFFAVYTTHYVNLA